MAIAQRMKNGKMRPVDWLRTMELMIAACTTPPRKRGKWKGHGDTDSVKAFGGMLVAMNKYIARKMKGKTYDGNMALAASLGRVFVTWYCLVHRAKIYDPNRSA